MPRKPVGNDFAERAQLPNLDAAASSGRGVLHDLDAVRLAAHEPQLHYEHPRGRLHIGDSLAWLAGLEAGSVEPCEWVRDVRPAAGA